jgi:hypothetical protein
MVTVSAARMEGKAVCGRRRAARITIIVGPEYARCKGYKRAQPGAENSDRLGIVARTAGG